MWKKLINAFIVFIKIFLKSDQNRIFLEKNDNSFKYFYQKFLYMKISKNALKILESLSNRGELGIDELSKLTHITRSNISRAIRELRNFGVITTKQVGYQKILSLTSYEFSDLFRTAIASFSIKDFYNILSGNRLELVALLGRKKTLKELTNLLSVNKKTIKNNLKFLLLRGIINEKKNDKIIYYVRPKFYILSRLALYLIHKAKETEVRKLFRNVLLVKVIEQDVLIKTAQYENVKGYYPTCYNVFRDYGIYLILTDEFYWVNRKPELEDIIVQTLKLDKDSTRGTIYVAALMYKNWDKLNVSKLYKISQKYKVDKKVGSLIGFVKNKTWKKKGNVTYPDWSEVQHVLRGEAYG